MALQNILTLQKAYNAVLLALGLSLLSAVSTALYNVYVHPLAKYPGPKLWAAFRLPFVISFWRGNTVHDIHKIHQRYGDIVRVAPNEIDEQHVWWHACIRPYGLPTEISFADGTAWKEIHNHRFPKNPIWWGELPGRTPSIVSTPDLAVHERMRRLLNHCFTHKALMAQEPTLRHYIDLLITKLKERTKLSGDANSTTVNIVDWYNFTTFDIIGDLGFGDPFLCLQNGVYHPWVATIFSYFKIGSLVATIRYYPFFNGLLFWFMPKSALKSANDNYAWAIEKVNRRLNLETPREDFMSHIMRENHDEDMSIPEIHNNANVLIVAGSETIATALSGMTNYLTKHPLILDKLVTEVRKAFARADEITLTALTKLPYLNAVIEESLRVCPPVASGLQRLVPAGGDTVCGNRLPEGTNVSVHQWSLYRNPKYFHEPNSFRPERWLPETISDPKSPFHNDDRAAVQAFAVGPTSCIGKNLAYGEMRLILSLLVWNFDIAADPSGRDVDWDSQQAYMVMEKQPFDVKLVCVRQ